jgi:hypothetical protein
VGWLSVEKINTSPQPQQAFYTHMETIMIANGIHHSNGNGTNGVHAQQLYPACASDYEAVAIDITPQAAPAKGNWRDQLAPVTWSMSYTDSSGISHSCTLRGDTEEEVLSMVKPIVAGVRKAKQLAKERAPQQTETPVPDSDVPPCAIHGTPMERRTSKRTGGIYFSHRLPGSKELCFGREPKA